MDAKEQYWIIAGSPAANLIFVVENNDIMHKCDLCIHNEVALFTFHDTGSYFEKVKVRSNTWKETVEDHAECFNL